jgi:Flp pilus assembly protein TadD/glycosyltransferase involved in cell wall biosynthesis
MNNIEHSKYLVSAFVSTYNSMRFMEGRLENLIDQTLYKAEKLEIIVVDSCSQQKEGQIVKKFMRYCNHIVYVRTSERETVYGAWNRGIQIAKGKYVINANTDDRFVENALEKMSYEMETNSKVAAVYGDWLQTGTENDRFDSDSPKELFSYPEYNPLLFFHGQITSHAALIRKEVFEKIGSFNADFKVYGDREFMLRFAVNGLKAKKIPEIVGLYLNNPNGLEFTKKITSDAEFNELLDRFLLPEYFIRFFNDDKYTRSGNLAHMYVCAADHGKEFCKLGHKTVSNLGTAGVLFCKALEYDDCDTICLNNLGIISCLSGDHAKGIGLFEKASTYASSDQKADIATNINLAQKDVKILPEYKWLTIEFAKNHNQKEITMKSPQNMYQEIQPLIENGWYDVALIAYEKLLEGHPQFSIAHNDLGVLYYNQGIKDKAQLHYEKAVEFEAGNITFQKNLADFYYAELGRVEDALRIYVEILKSNPQDAEILLITGHICVALQHFDDAKDFYRRVLEIEPWNADARQNLEKLPNGLPGANTSQSVEEIYQAAQRAMSEGRGQEAIQRLETVLAASPEHAQAHNDFGVLSYRAGDKKLALHHYKTAAQIEPNNITYQKNLADYYCIELGQFESAMRIYVKILENHPEDVETLMAVGYICENLNKSGDARDFYNRVIEIEPWNLEARQKLDALNIPRMAM